MRSCEKLPEQVRKPSSTSRDSGATIVTMPGSKPHLGDPSIAGTSERFAEDAHKDERWEGGVIGPQPLETSRKVRKNIEQVEAAGLSLFAGGLQCGTNKLELLATDVARICSSGYFLFSSLQGDSS